MNTMSVIAYTSNHTPIYLHPECHPHRVDDVAREAIRFMVVPSRPANPADRAQTKVVFEHKFEGIIGTCNLVETTYGDDVYFAARGKRPYQSRMVLAQPAPTNVLTSVVIWDADNSKWVLLTNFNGISNNVPEEGCDAYNRGTEQEQEEWDKYWWQHALVPEKEDLARHIEEKAQEASNDELWLDDAWYTLPLIDRPCYRAEVENKKAFVKKMKDFYQTMYK